MVDSNVCEESSLTGRQLKNKHLLDILANCTESAMLQLVESGTQQLLGDMSVLE